jgi:hypothetical protein
VTRRPCPRWAAEPVDDDDDDDDDNNNNNNNNNNIHIVTNHMKHT